MYNTVDFLHGDGTMVTGDVEIKKIKRSYFYENKNGEQIKVYERDKILKKLKIDKPINDFTDKLEVVDHDPKELIDDAQEVKPLFPEESIKKPVFISEAEREHNILGLKKSIDTEKQIITIGDYEIPYKIVPKPAHQKAAQKDEKKPVVNISKPKNVVPKVEKSELVTVNVTKKKQIEFSGAHGIFYLVLLTDGNKGSFIIRSRTKLPINTITKLTGKVSGFEVFEGIKYVLLTDVKF